MNKLTYLAPEGVNEVEIVWADGEKSVVSKPGVQITHIEELGAVGPMVIKQKLCIECD